MTHGEVQPRIIEWDGKGKLLSKDFEVQSSFKLEFHIGSEAILFFSLDMLSKARDDITRRKLKDFRFYGELENGVKISIGKLLLTSLGNISNGKQMPLKLKVFSEISINRSDFIQYDNEKLLFRLCNLEFTGNEKTFFPAGGWKLDHVSLTIDGYSMELRKIRNYDQVLKSLKKDDILKAETAYILVNAKHKDHEKVFSIVSDLCMLLSFAKGNTINPFGEIHLDGTKVVHEKYWNMRTEPFRKGDYVIPDLPFELLQKFLEQTYPNFKTYKDALGLNAVLNYYDLMRTNPILDARCVLGYILLECLADNAKEFFEKKGDPITSSQIRSRVAKLKKMLPDNKAITKKIIDKLTQEFIYPYPSLQDSMNKLMKEFKMKYKKNEPELFSLRKEFIHKGEFPSSVPPLETYNNLVHFIDRLILHILGYTHEFLDVSDGFKHKKLQYIP